MPTALGGIGQQVADNLFELGKSAARATADAGKKIAETTIEQISGAPSGVGAQQSDKKPEPSQAQREQEAAVKKQKERQQYERVKAELEQYRARKRQQDEQIAREKANEKQQEDQKKAVEKQEKESFVQKLLKRAAGGSHGETDRQKE